jgi:mannitol/fructose-specific phosphotransferase system IIA component
MAELGALLDPGRIRLDGTAVDRFDAVTQVGALLVEAGAVADGYVDSMLARERSISTYVGEGIAIPHGTADGKAAVLSDALAVLRYPDGIDWDGSTVEVCIGIAAAGDGHLPVLAALAEILMDPDRAAALRAATSADEVRRLLTEPVEDDE